jgi:hypothetical protein
MSSGWHGQDCLEGWMKGWNTPNRRQNSKSLIFFESFLALVDGLVPFGDLQDDS